MLLKDIAAKLGVPEGTVRRWKNTQKWADKKSERSETKKANVRKRKGGAPKGNKNAVGNKSSKPRNQKAVKHGAYAAVFFDFLSEEDKALVEAMNEIDVEERLLMEIQTLTIRQKRVMKAIEAQKKVKSKLYVASIDKTDNKRSFEGSEEEQEWQKEAYENYKEAHNQPPGNQSQITTRTEATIDLISRLDRELTSIQRQITADLKLLDEVRQKRIENARADELLPLQKERIDAEIERLDAQTSKILGTNLELEDTTEADELLYGAGMEVTADAPEAPDPEE
jgi:uncharacterized protein YjcR